MTVKHIQGVDGVPRTWGYRRNRTGIAAVRGVVVLDQGAGRWVGRGRSDLTEFSSGDGDDVKDEEDGDEDAEVEGGDGEEMAIAELPTHWYPERHL